MYAIVAAACMESLSKQTVEGGRPTISILVPKRQGVVSRTDLGVSDIIPSFIPF
ncbi:MAG: hypothetical protein WCO23_04185 [bacterium]